MITLRRAEERGRSDLGWLDSRHSFSFSGYYDPEQMGFGDLRVINEDRVRGGAGFGTHPHRDMEIISYVLEGGLEHKDSMGTGSMIRPGEVQVMSAGTGVTHSEYNASKSDPVHFLQIWILPRECGVTPRYDQKAFDAGSRNGQLQLVVSGDGAEDSLQIGQDASLYLADLAEGAKVEHVLTRGRGWVQVVRGNVRVNGKELRAGDGAALSDETTVEVVGTDAKEKSEILLFDLA
jgi:redox-sensitive bicupin YhaK (pirin superfamily)